MTVIKLPSGKWLCEYYPYGKAAGKRVRKQFATKGKALSHERIECGAQSFSNVLALLHKCFASRARPAGSFSARHMTLGRDSQIPSSFDNSL